MCSSKLDQTFWIFHFYAFLDFYTQKKKKKLHESKIKNKNNAYKEMHDAQMHDNEISNARKVLQR